VDAFAHACEGKSCRECTCPEERVEGRDQNRGQGGEKARGQSLEEGQASVEERREVLQERVSHLV